ncbi:MAG: DUF1674 domain-containing protein [Steroidobacteraceae bacterium]
MKWVLAGKVNPVDEDTPSGGGQRRGEIQVLTHRFILAFSGKLWPVTSNSPKPGEDTAPVGAIAGATRVSVVPPPAAAAAGATTAVSEVGGRDGPDPTRFGDWELRGRCIDF